MGNHGIEFLEPGSGICSLWRNQRIKCKWSKLELGHIDYQNGRFDEATAKFKGILDELSPSSPLAPLTRLSLAQSYEEGGQYDQAIAQYNLLKKDAGFRQQANLALGRIFMAKGEESQARKVYEELLQGPHLSRPVQQKALLFLSLPSGFLSCL